MKGINNKILKVNLSKQSSIIDKHNDNFYRKYIGGRGIALYYMHKEMEAGIDAFNPGNMLVFANGLLTGIPGPAVPRFTVCAKSPLTGGFGESEAGGFWGPELKRAGFDAIIITGKAKKPVYLWIKDGEVLFKDATHIWGKETGDAETQIRSELKDQRIRIAQIGPGGENLVKYANITNDLRHYNGRTGMGAVMGSKRLKAIAVRGTKRLPVAEKEKIVAVSRWAADEGMENPLAKGLHEVGTTASLMGNNEVGALPTRNWNKSYYEDAEKISGERMQETIGHRPGGCFSCPVRCKRVVSVEKENLKVDSQYGGPEYETLAAMGPVLEINDLSIIAKANELCNRNTIDTISAGMTVAFAMECYENGLLSKEDFDGLELNFGNGEAALSLIEKIVNREGIGDLLAEGSLSAAQKIGKGADKFIHQVKGQEIPMHDPRVKTGVGLQYALADYGADHMKAAHDVFYSNEDSHGTRTTKAVGIYEPVAPESIAEDKVRLFKALDNYWSLLDMLGACHFGFVPRGAVPLDKLMQLVQAATGQDISLYELIQGAERATDMSRLFNIKEGFTAEDDKLPEVFFSNIKNGPLKNKGAIDREKFEEAVQLRYNMMGWNDDGVPKKSKIFGMDLEDVVKV